MNDLYKFITCGSILLTVILLAIVLSKLNKAKEGYGVNSGDIDPVKSADWMMLMQLKDPSEGLKPLMTLKTVQVGDMWVNDQQKISFGGLQQPKITVNGTTYDAKWGHGGKISWQAPNGPPLSLVPLRNWLIDAVPSGCTATCN